MNDQDFSIHKIVETGEIPEQWDTTQLLLAVRDCKQRLTFL